MKCNGCGCEIDRVPGAVFGYGGPTELPDIHNRATLGKAGMWTADHFKTLCHACAGVMKDILLNSDLSKHHG